MVQSLGISIGNLNSYVAAGQGGGIEILLNEYSNRSTPSMVAFTDHARSIGVDASSNFFMNMKNTIYDLMVLLRKPCKEIASDNYAFKLEEAEDGNALVVVRHLGEERKFTITQVLAMLFTKLRGVALGATDCVLSCPQFYTDPQKEALVQAALIAGLNPLQLISDMSAVVLNYAYYRTTREDTHKIKVFINFGQSNLQAVVAWLNPQEDIVRILASESIPVGGKDFDKLLADYMVKQHSLNLTPKSYLKLLSACEKVKKLLSSNTNKIPLHVESLISDEKDFTAQIDRATFEELSEDIFKQIEACLKRLAKAAEAAQAAAIAQVAATGEGAAAPQAPPAKQDAAAEAPSNGEVPDEDGAVPNDASDAPKGVSTAPNEGGEMPEEVPMTVEEKSEEKPQKPQVPEKPKVETKVVVENVELVGGSTRIPAVKQLVQKVLGLGVSTTLNTDEAVARGCVLHCATLHPGIKVKGEIKILGAEDFYKPVSITCDKDLRRIELELITSDSKYKTRTEARNNLEEYVYSERSKLQEGDSFLEKLSATLEWLFSDEGEEAPEDEYYAKMGELKKTREAILVENNNKEQ